ncbi:AAA family ATPase [Paenibacillus sp. UNC451MF]|uniref:AAA family ATPase n=1 Tax=Paenibacillus sp. UNC451MF TaxID=1449063 RepID=UPI00048B7783|nr:AAA family ATPase [Paenibacillus sp. UNC451MF]
MIELPGYRTLHLISANGDIELYRLLRQEDGQSFVGKTTSEPFPRPAMVDAFQYEYDILRNLNGQGAIEAYALEFAANRPVTLLRDMGGQFLDQILRTRANTFGLVELLSITAAAADCLLQIHRANITLNEITPSQFFVNPDTLEVKFIDIRMCSTHLDISPLSLLTDRSDIVLPYISPEQTGRTGSTPDYRSDFYSLGVTLYEWLSGSLPYKLHDELDSIYHHLASKPEPLHLRVPSIPKTVSDIIGKCMEKMSDKRYLSAFGIKSDLEECLNRVLTSGTVEAFELASKDIPDRWIIPNHFYGRRTEQRLLLEALQRSTDGAEEVVWVCGNGGIGKTTLVNETLAGSLFEGFFARGKFDPLHTARPYEMWIQAIGELVSQLLMQSMLQAEVWKLRIVNAVEGYGQLLIELVPKLELLIGPQPPVQPLPPVEAQRRFQLIMNRFIQLFLQQGRPLVLFFDDLQWADETSLQYLAYLLEDRNTKGLLVVGAYRSMEMMEELPFNRLVKELAERHTAMSTIHLEAFEMADMKQLLKDAMRYETAETDELAAVLLHKTEGNPFFLKQFLQDLIDNSQVSLDESSRSWRWNKQHITEMNVPDNAADYMLEKLKLLSYRAVYVLGRAASLGNRFDLNMLASIAEVPLEDLSKVLGVALREGLLQPVSSEEGLLYKFQHDRIQQAAYALVPEAERSDLHWSIGLYLSQLMEKDESELIFEAVNHLNQAWERAQRPELKLKLAELNLQAGLKSKQATAYETSLGYLRFATSLLGEDSWDHAYSLTFQAFRERAEAEFLCAQFVTANELFDLLIHRAETDLDKALVLTMKIQLESTHDNYKEVISLGRSTLELLNVRHNFDPSTFELTLQWLKLTRKIRKHPFESLNQLAPMTDEARKIAMTALVHTGHASFYINKKGWLASSFTMVEMTLDYGMTPEASIGFIGYAMFLYFIFHKHEEAFKWGMLACNISKPYPTLYVKTLTSFALCSDSWRQYDPTMLETMTEHAGKVGLESGDLWHGNQSVLINGGMLLNFGHPLEDIYNRLIAHSKDFQRHNNSLHWKQATIFVALLIRLMGNRAPDDPFIIEDIYKADFAESVHGDEFNMIQELVYVLEYLPGYLFGQYREAKEALEKTAAIVEARKDNNENGTLYMYQSLVWAQLFEEASTQEQRVYRVSMSKHLKKLKRLAMRCPHNHLHKYLLIEAEMARVARKHRQAEEMYEQSIEAARLYGHIHDLGIAAECYGKYGLSQGKQQLAKIYMTEAYEAFHQWGAKAKTADMEQKYGHLLHVKRESILERVDPLSVALSAQALSGEMEMDRLLEKLMRIMLQNAGAEYGAIIFNHEGSWSVEAYGTAEEQCIESIPLEEDSDLVPAAIIGYSAVTQEEVVLNDAAKEGMFARNSYVRDKGLKSVLCLPIMLQNKLIGLLYMENKLSAGVFTPQRLEMLKLLGSQCAISLENARLYSGIQNLNNRLEDQVEERTRSLEQSMRETFAALVEVSVYEERNRIARDIHDIVGHTLTSTLLQIEAGKRLLHKDLEGASTRLKEAQDLVRHSLSEIRGSIHMLKEDKYADLALTLNQLIQDAERNMGVVIHAAIHDLPELSTAHKKMIYHALQEGLTNGIRHGRSKEFRFSLELVGAYLQFRLEDRGTGADTIHIGFGLKAMKERAEQLGGSLSIESWPDRGCLLKIELPHPMRLNGDR